MPIPLPEKVLQTSSSTILLYTFVLQTGLAMADTMGEVIELVTPVVATILIIVIKLLLLLLR